jgi:hypothetical protein
MSDLSEKVLGLSVPYLGPAAKVFMERQTNAHMAGLAFDALESKHLAELSKWIDVSAGLIIEETKAKELSLKIAALGK